jgi:hypothetical protein
MCLLPHGNLYSHILYEWNTGTEAHVLLECEANTELARIRSVFLTDIMSTLPPQNGQTIPPFEFLCSLVGDDRVVQQVGKFIFDMLTMLVAIPIWKMCIRVMAMIN